MLEYGGKEMNWRPGGECLAPFVSLKDRTVVGCADRGLNCTNRMPGVGGSRTGKPSTALL